MSEKGDTSYTLSQLEAVADTIKGPISPLSHLQKLVQYLEYSKNDSATEFFLHLLNDTDACFAKIKSHWSDRTISAAMESMLTLLQDNSVQKEFEKELEKEDLVRIMEFIASQKKQYMNSAKRQQRSQASSSTKKADKNDKERVVETQEHELDEVHMALETPVEKPPEHNARTCIERAAWILDKYIDGETDDFKVIVLEIMQKEISNALLALRSISL
jgi:hypothetical protein